MGLKISPLKKSGPLFLNEKAMNFFLNFIVIQIFYTIRHSGLDLNSKNNRIQVKISLPTLDMLADFRATATIVGFMKLNPEGSMTINMSTYAYFFAKKLPLCDAIVLQV